MSQYIAPGDKDALKAYLSKNGRAIYGRALALTGSDDEARTATRHTMEAVVRAFELGLLDSSSEWLMELTKRCADTERIKHKGIDGVVESMRVMRNIEQYGPLVSDDERNKRVDAALSRMSGTGAPEDEESEPAPAQNARPHSRTEYRAPAHEAPVYEIPACEAPAHEAPAREIPAFEAPAYTPRQTSRQAREADEPPRYERQAEPLFEEQRIPRKAAEYEYEANDAHEDDGDAGTIDLFDTYEDEDDGFAPPRRRAKRREKSEAGIATVLLIFALMFVVAFLTWMLVVMLMTRGILPLNDFGFAEWFNANLFKLY